MHGSGGIAPRECGVVSCCVVIASQRVRAKRGPMTGSAKQSIYPRAEAWIASLGSQ